METDSEKPSSRKRSDASGNMKDFGKSGGNGIFRGLSVLQNSAAMKGKGEDRDGYQQDKI